MVETLPFKYIYDSYYRQHNEHLHLSDKMVYLSPYEPPPAGNAYSTNIYLPLIKSNITGVL
jgi:hypothetical protein